MRRRNPDEALRSLERQAVEGGLAEAIRYASAIARSGARTVYGIVVWEGPVTFLPGTQIYAARAILRPEVHVIPADVAKRGEVGNVRIYVAMGVDDGLPVTGHSYAPASWLGGVPAWVERLVYWSEQPRPKSPASCLASPPKDNPSDAERRALERQLRADPSNRVLWTRVNKLRVRQGLRPLTPPWVRRSAARARSASRHATRRSGVVPDVYIEQFLASYLETALWSSNDESDPETGGDPMDENYSIGDISQETRSHARTDCTSFILNNWEDLVSSGLSASDAGHNFWLTRNRHGAGFCWHPDKARAIMSS